MGLKTTVSKTRSVLTMRDMEIGELAIIADDLASGESEGAVVLSTYTGVVSLENPEDTWSKDCLIRVSLLPVGAKVTLEVTE